MKQQEMIRIMKKGKICTTSIHSIVDVITNSSTELFCTVKGTDEDTVTEILNNIISECGCKVLDSYNGAGLSVEPHYCTDEESADYEKEIPGLYDICYEYSTEPCKIIIEKIRKVFEVVEEYEN